MRLCHKQPDGKNDSCVTVPGWPPPFPNESNPLRNERQQGAGLYSEFITDAWALNAIHIVAKGITSDKARNALHSGVESAVHALQERIGKDWTISLGD